MSRAYDESSQSHSLRPVCPSSQAPLLLVVSGVELLDLGISDLGNNDVTLYGCLYPVLPRLDNILHLCLCCVYIVENHIIRDDNNIIFPIRSLTLSTNCQ